MIKYLNVLDIEKVDENYLNMDELVFDKDIERELDIEKELDIQPMELSETHLKQAQEKGPEFMAKIE